MSRLEKGLFEIMESFRETLADGRHQMFVYPASLAAPLVGLEAQIIRVGINCEIAVLHRPDAPKTA